MKLEIDLQKEIRQKRGFFVRLDTKDSLILDKFAKYSI